LSLWAFAHLSTIFGALSPHPKIPFPAAGFGREVRAQLQPCSGLCTAVIRDLGPALQLFRIESERLKLSAPFSRWIAEPLDADAAGQATFYGRFDKIGCEEGERDGHIDLSPDPRQHHPAIDGPGRWR